LTTEEECLADTAEETEHELLGSFPLTGDTINWIIQF